MSGYSRMRQPFKLQKPKSMDSFSDSDLFYFSQPQKNNMKITPNDQENPSYEINNLHSSPNPKIHIEVEDDEDKRKIDDGHDLKSIGKSSTMNSTRGFNLSRGRSGRLSADVESAVKKVLPMRRSSSVSESYCRIVYDEFLEIDEGCEVGAEPSSTKKKTKKMGNGVRILKACKRIFGL